MAVRFEFPSTTAIAHMTFGWSPLLEAAQSLKVLAHPKRWPMHLPWARRCADLPDDLVAALRVVVWEQGVPGIFEMGLASNAMTFEDELDAMRSMDPLVQGWELSLGLGGAGCQREWDPTEFEDPDYRDGVLAVAGDRGDDIAAFARRLFDDPASATADVAAAMARYWELGFRDEWERLWPRLEAEVTHGARVLVCDGIGAVVRDLLPEAQWDEATSTIEVPRTWSGRVDVAERGPLVMTPTVYGWPSVLLELSPALPLAAMFPLRDMRQPEVLHAADHEVADGLRALGDETRLQVARMVADQPRSTKELAQLLSLSESAVSRHLKVLARAGILSSRRDGYFVLYQLEPERIGAIGAALRRTLGLARTPSGRVPPLPVDTPHGDVLLARARPT